jgi:hypothetical protein
VLAGRGRFVLAPLRRHFRLVPSVVSWMVRVPRLQSRFGRMISPEKVCDFS